MAKQVAPVSLTGGMGFRFEDCVAGRILTDMLAGLQSFGPELGLVSQLDWQTRYTGRLLDDLIVILNTKDSAHRVEFSITIGKDWRTPAKCNYATDGTFRFRWIHRATGSRASDGDALDCKRFRCT
jgi:hypothetical protein